MKLDYIDDIPFEYVMSDINKDIKLSDKLKMEFNHYYIDINKSDNKDIDRWTQDANTLKRLVELEVRETGNKKSIYVTDYVQFIFGVSYLFFNKFHMTQREVASILGMTTTKYSKLDIFPYRCYSAFTKLDDKKKRKSLIPNDVDSEGIRIAECINKKVQARYACCGFIGVSNDFDLFANIATTDKKKFIMTVPSNRSQKLEITMGDAGFLLASSNNLDNVKGNYVAGEVKRKIIELLEMRHKIDFSYNPKIDEILQNDDLCWKFLTREKWIEDSLKKYKISDYLLNEIYENEYFHGLDGYENIDVLDIPEDVICSDDDYETLVKWLEDRKDEWRMELIGNMTYAFSKKYDANNFVDYRLCLYQEMLENLKVNCNSSSAVECMNTEEEKILYAAIYWIFNVFGVDIVDEKLYKAARKSLKTKKLLSYIDAINKEVSNDDRTHIALVTDNYDLGNEIEQFCNTGVKQYRSVMVYIDISAYPCNDDYLVALAKNNNIVLVIRDKDDIIAKKCFRELDRDMKLYFMEETHDGI